jgi:hypothetical protein
MQEWTQYSPLIASFSIYNILWCQAGRILGKQSDFEVSKQHLQQTGCDQIKGRCDNDQAIWVLCTVISGAKVAYKSKMHEIM